MYNPLSFYAVNFLTQMNFNSSLKQSQEISKFFNYKKHDKKI